MKASSNRSLRRAGGPAPGEIPPSRDPSSRTGLPRIVLILLMVVGDLILQGSGMAHPGKLSAAFPTLQKLFYLALVSFPAGGLVLLWGYEGLVLKLERALSFWIQCLTYAVAIALVFFLLGKGDAKDLVSAAFPLSGARWWLATGYFALLLGSPFLNALADTSRGRLLYLLGLVGGLGILSRFTPSGAWLGANGSGLPSMVFLYLAGRYLRRFGIGRELPRGVWGAILAGGGILLFLGSWLLVARKMPSSIRFLREMGNPVLVVQAIAFLQLLRSSGRSHPWIERLGSMCFAVYLLQDHGLVGGWMYEHVFVIETFANGPAYGLFLGLFAGLVFAFGIGIETVRLAAVRPLLAALAKTRLYAAADRWSSAVLEGR